MRGTPGARAKLVAATMVVDEDHAMHPTIEFRAMLACAIACACCAHGRTASADDALDRYAAPERLVTIDGARRLNLRCSGDGAQTILLEAGGAADSTSWYRVQPLLAGKATVCSYDRAGYGYSDEGPLPRDLDADVRDLDRLIDKAALHTPLVLVGHSLGTNIVRRYAAQHADRVAALVLVDPSAQNIAEFAPDWGNQDDAANVQRDAMLKACRAGAETGQLASPPPALKDCLLGPNPAFDKRTNAALRATKERPAFWNTLVSELGSNVALFKRPVASDESLGTLPVVVLVAADTYAEAPPEDRKLLEAARAKTVAQILAGSTRSRRVDVAGSSHDMQLDQPHRVADAVLEASTTADGGAAAKHR
jgi:pimeloyl-ACP methyl ester carboxylesterase